MEFPTPTPDDPVRVAVIVGGVGPHHPLTRTLEQLRHRGLEGYEIEPISADAGVQALTERHYDLVHVCGPSPATVPALLTARAMGLAVAAGYDAEFSSRAQLHTATADGWQDPSTQAAAFYGRCDAVLSPGHCADAALADLGISPERIVRWEAGVDATLFNPAGYAPEALGIPAAAREAGTFNLLYVGELAPRDGIELVVESFLIAHDRDPRLHLVLAGHGPGRSAWEPRLGAAATFLGRLEVAALARVYASADLLVFASATDTFGQAILEAQASGLPVLAIAADTAAELIESGRSGCLAPADPAALASAIRGLARRAAVLDRLATGGLLAVRGRPCERSLEQLAWGYAWTLSMARGEGSPPPPELAQVPHAA